jgi:hypothetical protein
MTLPITREPFKTGRPTKYKPEYCEMIIEYFDQAPTTTIYKTDYNRDGSVKSETPITVATQFPTFQGFAHSLDVGMTSLIDWQNNYPEFAIAYARAKGLQEQIWLINSMDNRYNSQFAQFFGKNCLGYKDRTELSGPDGGPIQLAAVDYSKLTTTELEELEIMASKALPE